MSSTSLQSVREALATDTAKVKTVISCDRDDLCALAATGRTDGEALSPLS